ncbi:solute carrier family 30 (zinc transporter), member 6 [Mytilus galloprovincialis]|uniref:Solute carrier family 30 (Zinc transporter), member 6 n=1 Tax=Mytilus galloprovincialis TaxID=29158 RepID=A0A8B6GVW7_MYTGA|nr:solute carrier family 30 (zinc transporter), member 6 [Mytilus galloprovincialis]
MSTFHSVPDIIQSSVSLDLDDGQFSRERTKYYTSGTIYPLATQKSFFKTVLKEISNVTRLQQSKKILTFLVFNFICTFVLLIWCHTTNSMALTAYTYLTMFDCLSLLVCLLTLWVQMQKPTSTYSFGYERYEVLGVFASTMLAQLGSLFILKESVERMFIQPDIHTGRLLIGTLFAFFVHFTLTYSINNRAMNHVVDASSSSWLQEHMTDMSESVCHIIPGLSKLLLPRINPMALIGFTGGIAVIITHILIDTKSSHTTKHILPIRWGISQWMFHTTNNTSCQSECFYSDVPILNNTSWPIRRRVYHSDVPILQQHILANQKGLLKVILPMIVRRTNTILPSELSLLVMFPYCKTHLGQSECLYQ